MKHESFFLTRPVLKLRRAARERLGGRDAEVRRSATRVARPTFESQRAKRLRPRLCVDRGTPMNDVQEHASRKAPPGAPNVLCVIIDDVGFGWIDAFGGLVETPNLTRLARAGLRYVNHHAPASPAETTACLLTGRNQHWVSLDAAAEASEFRSERDGGRREDEAALRDMLHEHGYASLCLDGELAPRPRSHREGHVPEDLVDRAATFAWHRRSEDPDRPWLCYLRFDARRGSRRIAPEWSQKYVGTFDGGWDYYRTLVFERQKKIGLVAPHAELAPMLEGARAWENLSAQEKRRYARMAELYAGGLAHIDAQLGRLMDFLGATGQLDDTLVFVLLGSARGGAIPALADRTGRASGHESLPMEWALASNTPFKLYEQDGKLGGTRCPLIVHWPKGIRSKGEIRTQFHHVVDVLPTILSAIGVEPVTSPADRRAAVDGVAMNYTFDDASATTRHDTQHFEMLGNRAIVRGRWKAVAYRPQPPRGPSDIRFHDDRWELYDLDKDPSECRDLLAAEDVRDVAHPMARQLIELVGLWWAEARKYELLPLDVGLVARELAGDGVAREGHEEPQPASHTAPEQPEDARLDRSWAIAADVVVPLGGASGPIVAMADEGDGWSLYLKDGAPTFCCKLAASGITLVRSPEKLGPGPHSIRYEFEKRGTEQRGAGIGRLVVDGRKVAEVPLAPSIAFDSSLDQSIEIGCDKGVPITDEYAPHASFTGKIVQVEMDLHPDFNAGAGHACEARPRGAPLLQ
jgi:arylsulfatase